MTPTWTKHDLQAYLTRIKARSELSAAKPECLEAPALVSPVSGETKSVRRPTVRIVFCRHRPLDRDNYASGGKDILDGLRHAGLIPGDSEAEIDLQVEQVKVAHRNEQKTVIVIGPRLSNVAK